MTQCVDQHYIIAYDICDKKRLQKVHRIVKEYAMSLQHSVFIAPFDQNLLDELIGKLNNIIKASEDDIRMYPLSTSSQPEVYGCRKLPHGIFLNNIMDHETQEPFFI